MPRPAESHECIIHTLARKCWHPSNVRSVMSDWILGALGFFFSTIGQLTSTLECGCGGAVDMSCKARVDH